MTLKPNIVKKGTVKFAMSAVTTRDEAGAIQPRSVYQRLPQAQ